ncbi:MAG: hypothetical protein GF334_07530, partial [Candidatus Altiarchaeales archaeon]|nr:hypothetical protein [Candidatus Altiarchaeales archaeon]
MTEEKRKIYEEWVSRYPSLRVVEILEGMGLKGRMLSHNTISLHIDDLMRLIRKARGSD